MNKKAVVFVAIMAITLLLTPVVLAKPGAEKKNTKFQYFELVASGEDAGTGEKDWLSPPEGPPNVWHGRGADWDDETVDLVELTVGSETFDMDSDPYNVDYTTTYDIEVFYDSEGEVLKYNIRLTDTVTVYDEDEEIGTLVLKIKAVVDFTGGLPPTYAGTVMGYGTGDLKSVHISAIDLGLTNPDPLRYTRIGTITGWPEEITNIV